MSSTKIGRNDRCSCGSGKKYKSCCEGREARRASQMTNWALLGVGILAIALVGGFFYSALA